MKRLNVFLVFWLLTVQMEAYRLPGLNHFRHFRKSEQKPSFGNFLSSLKNLIVGKSSEASEVEEVENDEPKFEDKLQNLTSDALEEEDVVKDELFEDKMIPNPQVGVPYYLAFMMFNEEVEEHWMLTSTIPPLHLQSFLLIEMCILST